MLDEHGTDWECTYEILFPEERLSHTSHGVDSMQALQLAISTLDAELRARVKKLSGTMLFLGEPISSLLEGGGFGQYT